MSSQRFVVLHPCRWSVSFSLASAKFSSTNNFLEVADELRISRNHRQTLMDNVSGCAISATNYSFCLLVYAI